MVHSIDFTGADDCNLGAIVNEKNLKLEEQTKEIERLRALLQRADSRLEAFGLWKNTPTRKAIAAALSGEKSDLEKGAVAADARDEIERLRAAMTEFCERVERGEIRSRRTYAKFNELLGRAALPGEKSDEG